MEAEGDVEQQSNKSTSAQKNHVQGEVSREHDLPNEKAHSGGHDIVEGETSAMMKQVDTEKGGQIVEFDSDGNAVCSKSVASTRDETCEGDRLEGEYYQDNWLHTLLCYTWYGRVINLILFLFLVYVTFFTRAHPERAFFSRLFPKFAGFFLNLLSMNLVVVFFVYPLSRISQSQHLYWFIGSVGSILITIIGLFDWRGEIFNGLLRMGLAVEFSRLTMKVVSFLVECNRSKDTFENTNVLSFLYFMFAPTLIYKTTYPRTPKIRLISLVHYIGWIVIVCILSAQVYYDFMLPLAQVDVVTVGLYGLAMLSLYIFIFTPLVYSFAVMFGYFEIWNGLFGELLRFSERRVFGPPRDFLDPTKIIRAMNILVSDFLSHYIYKPVYNATKSRLIALTTVFFISLSHHEICLSFTLTQLLFVNLIPPFLAGPFLLKRKPNIVIRLIRSILLGVLFPFYMYLHIVEYFAWNTSSIKNIEAESKIRLVPLSLGYLLRAIFYPDSTGSMFSD